MLQTQHTRSAAEFVEKKQGKGTERAPKFALASGQICLRRPSVRCADWTMSSWQALALSRAPVLHLLGS